MAPSDDQPLLGRGRALGEECYGRRSSAAATSRSSSTRARCWRSSANPAPARPRCCSCCRRSSSRMPGRVSLSHARRRDARSRRRSARPSGASCSAPIGAMCTRIPRSACAWRSPPAANVGERLMAVGWRHYGRIRDTAAEWLDRVEIDRAPHRRCAAHLFRRHAAAPADRAQSRDRSRASSSWTSRPAASTCRCRRACSISCAASSPSSASPRSIVTHDLAVARLLSHRIMVMKGGEVIETGPHRPGARRSARALYPAARLLDPARMRPCRSMSADDCDASSSTMRKDLHHASAGRRAAARGARA